MDIKTITFNYTGAVQTWTPPKGIARIKIECWGAQGGDMLIPPWTGKGGKGGYASGEVRLVKDQVLYLCVGGQGDGYNGYTNHYGGWNGGGTAYAGASGGGGGTDIRTDPNDLNSRIIVAGGGGGSNDHTNGGDGGGLTGNTGQTNGGIAGTGGTQTYGGIGWINGSFGVGGGIPNAYPDGGAGGGGWYGGAKGQGYDTTGGGGSSYVGNLEGGYTKTGVNSGNGKIVITYDDDTNIYILKKDNQYYIPKEEYFDIHSKTFESVSFEYIITNLLLYYGITKPTNFNDPFTINGETFHPADIINFSEYKICILTKNSLSQMSINYTPSSIALSKSNIKIKDEYTPISQGLTGTYLNITATDKSKIDYFIDYQLVNQDKLYKSGGILNTEILNNDFYLNFKLKAVDSLLKSVTMLGKNNDKYSKIKDYSIDIYNNFDDGIYISFYNNYNKILVNRIVKQELLYTIDTLDKF